MPPPPRRVSTWLSLSLFLMGSVASPALAADDFQRYLDVALQFQEDFEYEKALAQLQRARTVARGVEQDVLVGLYEGILLFELGREEEARSDFETVLRLESEAKLPQAVSPKVEREFEAIRQRVTARKKPSTPSPKPSAVTSAPKPVTDRPQKEASPPPRLVPSGSTPTSNPIPSVTTTAQSTSRPVPVVPLVLLGASAVAGGIGTAFGVTANQQYADARTTPYAEDAFTKLEGARGKARTANLLFGTAGLALAGAVVTWFVMPGSRATPSSSSQQETTR